MHDDMKNDLVSISLQKNTSWTMGMAGLVKWLTWETDNVLGITKTKLIKKVVEETMLKCKLSLSKQEVENIVKNINTPHPVKTQKRLRTESEDFLNREVDIFFSLLPNCIINNFFSHIFNYDFNNTNWNIVGNSGDFEDSMEMKFMQIDTIAYAPSVNNLIAIELKIDADLPGKQIKNYCFMAAYLEHKKKVDENVVFKLMVISPDKYTVLEIEELKKNAHQQIKDKDFPRKGVDFNLMERVSLRAIGILENLQIESITWQQIGDYFYNVNLNLPENPYIETHKKLISGFLDSLSLKYYKNQSKLFIRKPTFSVLTSGK